MDFIIIGLIIGIVSLVPGISGGTIVMLSKKKDYIYNSISDWKNNKLILIKLLVGIILGAILFANILEVLFTSYPVEVLSFFSGLIIFSTIKLIGKNKKILGFKYSLISFIIILLLAYIVPDSSIVSNPVLGISLILTMIVAGFIDGYITILPGISGSMVLMILGPYYIYKSLLANITLIYLIPLGFYLLFNMLGIYLGTKTHIKLYKRFKSEWLSIIIGFILGGILSIFPFEVFSSIDMFLKFIMIMLVSYIIMELTTK